MCLDTAIYNLLKLLRVIIWFKLVAKWSDLLLKL
jgi:hypothetical protein